MHDLHKSIHIDKWLRLLRCPVDGNGLSFQRTGCSTNRAVLKCAGCNGEFPIVDGVVRFLDVPRGQQFDNPLKAMEANARDTGAASYDARLDDLYNRLELVPCLKALQPNEQDVVVELGSGTGRATCRIAPLVKEVVAIDFSLKSLLHLRDRLPNSVRDNVLLVHADICNPPLAPRSFTKAVSVQVLEHVPTPAMRQQAVRAAARLLTPDGVFVCTVYNWSAWKQRQSALGLGDNTRKEGMHDTGIYYYNFVADELAPLFEAVGFGLDFIKGLNIGIRGGRFMGPLVVPLNRALSRSRYGLRHGSCLMTRARVTSAASIK